MKIVIDIPKKQYENLAKIANAGEEPLGYWERVVMRGTPLQKHGRLIDAKKFEAYIRDGFRDLNGEFKTEKYRSLTEQLTESFLLDIQEQETVVPAEKEVNE